MTPARIQSVGQVMITVENLETMVDFYRNTLGFEHLMSVQAQRMAFLRCGDVRLYLTESDDGPRSRPLLYYRVEDIQRVAAKLESVGVNVVASPHLVHRSDEIELWMAFFEDPEGLAFGLMEEVPMQP